MKIIPEDQITSYSYESICDYIFDSEHQNPKNGDILFLQIENFPLFVEYCKKTSNRHVIVSVRSDFGIEEQVLAHPNQDIVKGMNFVDWEQILNKKDAYAKVTLHDTYERGCNPKDKYSIKIYARTYYTFSEVPDNVIKWFACNVNVRHPKIINIPFGLSEPLPKEAPLFILQDKLLYVNFSNHTTERKRLNQSFENENSGELTHRYIPLPKNDYLLEMARHKFVLCPPGNGWDCWRTYEALYLGCIPIMEKSIFTSFFEDLPVLIIDDFFELKDSYLKYQAKNMVGQVYNYDNLKLSYWTKRIKDE